MFKFKSKPLKNYIIGAVAIGGLSLGITYLVDDSIIRNKNGFDSNGYDRDGYDCNGYDIYGRDRQGYDKSGYNIDGFNRLGYDSEGFDRQGYDLDGYDHSGRDKRGFDREGFDIDGYDRFGRDTEGYRRNGFGLDGFNREGYDWQGYDRDRYNASGLDRAGHCRQYYSDHITQLRDRLDEAFKQLQRGELRYAVYDARIVMEDTLRMIVQHVDGNVNNDDRMLINLKICEHKHLLEDNDFLDRLHDVRRICNANGHEFDAEENMSHNRVHFVVMQVRDLLDSAEEKLVTK